MGVLRKYEDKLQQQAALLKDCSTKAGKLKENHGASVDQVAAMQGLLRVLNLKLDALSRGNVGEEARESFANTFETGQGNFFGCYTVFFETLQIKDKSVVG